jgi:hypothetical protein
MNAYEMLRWAKVIDTFVIVGSILLCAWCLKEICEAVGLV